MNYYLLSASVLMLGLVLVHSVLGELKIFRQMNSAGLPHLQGFPIMRATDSATKLTLRMVWHLTSVLGLGITATTVHLALLPALTGNEILTVRIIGACMLACFAVAAVLSKGSHIAWVSFLIIGGLCLAGVW